MAIRTTETAVEAIIEVDTTISLTPFIEIASSIVDDVVDITGKPAYYTVAKLELIERWLSAHFYAIRDPRAVIEKAGAVGQTFKWQLGLNLANTRYGQMAMTVDSYGYLATMSKQLEKGKSRSVGVTWLGTGNTYGDDIST